MSSISIEIVKLENESYHLFIPCQINGLKREMVVDTGASKTVFDICFSDHFQLIEEADQKVISSGLGGEINLKMAKIPELHLADFTVKNLVVALIDLSPINEIYKQYCQKQIAGLLGSDFLLRFNAQIDYSKKQLTLSENNHVE